MAAAEEEREYSNGDTAAAINHLITSVDCDPKAALTFSDARPLRWNAIVDALNLANYYFATRRLADPPPTAAGVAYLVLRASKKAAFLHSGDSERQNRGQQRYEISYDERLMDELPSFRDLKGLPRFHLFTELPEELQASIVDRLDGVGFARMRCVSRRFRHLSWSGDFNIRTYSNPKAVE